MKLELQSNLAILGAPPWIYLWQWLDQWIGGKIYRKPSPSKTIGWAHCICFPSWRSWMEKCGSTHGDIWYKLKNLVDILLNQILRLYKYYEKLLQYIFLCAYIYNYSCLLGILGISNNTGRISLEKNTPILDPMQNRIRIYKLRGTCWNNYPLVN